MQPSPWQRGPAEILEAALHMLRGQPSSSNRLTFILLDLAAEAVFRTYLTLPDDLVDSAISYKERKMASRGSFHNLVAATRSGAGERLSHVDLPEIEYFHSMRNTLYHYAGGITVGTDDVSRYASSVLQLLHELLGLDLRDEAPLDQEELRRVGASVKALDAAIQSLRHHTKLVIEKAEPGLLMPSVIHGFELLSDDSGVQNLHRQLRSYAELMEQAVVHPHAKRWLLELVEPYLEFASDTAIANARFLFALCRDPVNIYLLYIGAFLLPEGNIDRGYLYSSQDISIVEDEDEHILGLYSKAKDLLRWVKEGTARVSPEILRVFSDQIDMYVDRVNELAARLSAWTMPEGG